MLLTYFFMSKERRSMKGVISLIRSSQGILVKQLPEEKETKMGKKEEPEKISALLLFPGITIN